MKQEITKYVPNRICSVNESKLANIQISEFLCNI